MNYGFAIDNGRCIGCHACSTACKSENSVPLGVYRTWVKYTETGAFPDTQRHFQVTRCNHCANPPCARICPTGAMYQRDDGIVEFNGDHCIGCKACMQACPYDAIYLDPETKTAAKCHYCSHRTEIGLEPACVVVCPTHAIIAGDLDNPDSEISRRVSRGKTTVRKPEQGTGPKLFYINGDDSTMHPTATERVPESYMWADALSLHGPKHGRKPKKPASMASMAVTAPITPGQLTRPDSRRKVQTQGLPKSGPIQVAPGATVAGNMVQVGYNAQHKVPWHWPVPAYLVTKGIAAGAFLLMALAHILGLPYDATATITTGVLVNVFMILTTILLIIDLERPERFLYILIRPNWNSWLTRGSIFLMGFSTLAGLWTAAEIAGAMDWMSLDTVANVRPWFLGFGGLLAAGTAIYTAFLFGQAEGRDLWQSGLLPTHLIVQAMMAGSAALLVAGAVVDFSPGIYGLAGGTFAVMVLLDLFVTLLGEFGMPHASEVAAQAAHEISHGRYAKMFWIGAIIGGHILPFLLVYFGTSLAVGALAGVLCLVGLYAYEHAFVMAPQEIPNS